ncbi:MAG: lycopene cyclase family protein [Microscillaceae bacterium]|nr:lycopene cyclase family protein [Microscillaceae bacterium]MDW8459854.1 lycopene cyclase family protein [Cytophagales bacterium]
MYDYIFAGAGCAALSLVYKMNQLPEFQDKKILLIDKTPKNQNDRTWCFWTQEPTAFEKIVSKTWEKIYFHAPPFEKVIPTTPYRYQMIRSIDFYEFILKNLSKNPNITWLYGNISQLYSDKRAAYVQVEGNTYQTKWAFNSLFAHQNPNPNKYHYLLQHFKGWLIETPQPTFNENIPTFMDFSIDQHHETRFMYILPHSPTRALVEFTLFSKKILTQEQYENQIQEYLKGKYHLTNFSILEKEFGIIPMTNMPFQQKHSPRIINIGTQGGYTKASTGYTFMNIQRKTDKILQNLIRKNQPFFRQPLYNRFRLYDATLLDVLARNRYEGKEIFRIMFEKHPLTRIFRFLDEQSHFWEELQIMASMPTFTFSKAFLSQMF